MSDKYKTLDFENDHGDSLLDKSADLEEPIEMEDHMEEPTEDSLGRGPHLKKKSKIFGIYLYLLLIIKNILVLNLMSVPTFLNLPLTS